MLHLIQRLFMQRPSSATDDIEEWYFNHQDQDLMNYLCRQRVLKKEDQGRV